MYDKGKRLRVLRYAKTCGKVAVIAAVSALGLASCVSGRVAVDEWADASLATRERLIIEEQRERLNDMGEAVGRVQGSLERAIGAVTASLDGAGSLESKFHEIDRFVRAVIESKRELEDIQRSNSGEDAGEG